MMGSKMRITSFNINKFCGAYSNPNSRGGYYNPKKLDFITPILKIVDSYLNSIDDIIFLQEFYDNEDIKTEKYFENEGYKVFYNKTLIRKSHVVAITFKPEQTAVDRIFVKKVVIIVLFLMVL